MEMLANPGLTVALALAVGIVAQSLARHLRIPGIVLLLLLGMILGPDGLGLIWPETLGSGLATLVGFAVAVILFEGGMNLNLSRLRRAQRPIRRLVTIGALVTVVGGTLIAKLCLGWGWRISVLFGTLIIVTGPTVVNPLLRRLRVERSVTTILEAEGVLGDAIGAIAAVVALEIAIHPTGANLAMGSLSLLTKLGFGAGFGAAIGLLLGWLLRFRRVIPSGFENVFTLSFVLVLFQGANAVMPDTGIPAVAAAGAIVGNFKGIRAHRELREFKEQLTVMLIGLLFVLLAADVRLVDVRALGLRGALAVGLLLLVVRPLAVLTSTWNTRVTVKQRAFMSWIGPRGVVAAAVASTFSVRLAAHEHVGGQELRALVFLVVAASVLSAGVFGGLIGRVLGVRRNAAGWVILGANELAREVAAVLQEHGEDVVCIDTDAEKCRSAEEEGLSVLHGSGLREATLLEAEIEHRVGALAITPNDEVNYLFLERVNALAPVDTLSTVRQRKEHSNDVEIGNNLGSDGLFGHQCDVGVWSEHFRKRGVQKQWWRLGTNLTDNWSVDPVPTDQCLFVAIKRRQAILPATSATNFRKGDVAQIFLHETGIVETRTWLTSCGWVPERRSGECTEDSSLGSALSPKPTTTQLRKMEL
jgi:NhaP-type Na+/H+ or K+/H+ antiporter